MNKLYALDTQDKYYEAKKKLVRNSKKQELDAVFSMKKSKQKKHKKEINKRFDQIQQDEEKCPKTKSIIEFDPSLACSIKSFAVKKKRLNKTNYQIF